MREGRTEVLVVGAGPVGLWTALSLAEAGVEVSIIDRESRVTARNYACALHATTLKLLDRFELASAAIDRGRCVQTLAFYEAESRRAELDLSQASQDFPFLLILPQSALESLLEQRLHQAGVSIQWNHRFEGLVEEQEEVCATLEELEGSSTGYIIPHWETVVKRRAPIRAQFLIGADGHNSTVRNKLGIDYEHTGEVQSFAAYEFEADKPADVEVRVVLDGASTNVLWPLAENRFRWTFQLSHSDVGKEFPEKDRRAVRLVQPMIDEQVRQWVERVARHRAPWFNAGVKQITWCTEVAFGGRLASRFGQNRCWLAGDAAHQTGPVGVQSMNAGFLEAEQLSAAVQRNLRQDADSSGLEGYNCDSRKRWRELLGISTGLRPGSDTTAWVREHCERILPCLPGVGPDLAKLAAQLKLTFQPETPAVASGLLSGHKSA